MPKHHLVGGGLGGGGEQSWCYLLGAGATPDSETRLQAIEASTDGFELAEVDLEIRGEGTVLGTRQKGQSDLKLASLRRDKEWVARAREVAFAVVDADPTLSGHEVLQEELRLLVEPEEAEFLFKS
jgi:ATP-dependent DNA helicase RecG